MRAQQRQNHLVMDGGPIISLTSSFLISLALSLCLSVSLSLAVLALLSACFSDLCVAAKPGLSVRVHAYLTIK